MTTKKQKLSDVAKTLQMTPNDLIALFSELQDGTEKKSSSTLTEAIRDNSSLFRFWNGQRACISRPVRLCVNAPHSGRRKSGFLLHRDEFYALQRVLSGRYFSRLRPFCQIEGQAFVNSFT